MKLKFHPRKFIPPFVRQFLVVFSQVDFTPARRPLFKEIAEALRPSQRQAAARVAKPLSKPVQTFELCDACQDSLRPPRCHI
jgi:hypothetical protein